jgi:hypothetical protein
MGDGLAVYVSVPFSYNYSKNKIARASVNRQGRVSVHVNPISKSLCDNLAWDVKQALEGRTFRKDKIFLDIMVEKPDHRGDALNVLDLIADGIKAGIGIDDRYFAIQRLDWVIKKNGRIIIGIIQGG